MKKGCCKTKVEQQSFFLWWLPGRQHHRGGNAAGCDVGGYRKRREGNRAYQLPLLPVMAVGAATPPGVLLVAAGSGEKEMERSGFRHHPLWLSAHADPPGVTWEDTGSGEKEIERTSFRHHPLWLSGRQRRRVCCWWQPGAERRKWSAPASVTTRYGRRPAPTRPANISN